MKDLSFGILLSIGGISLVSSFIWTLTMPGDKWLWFSRMCLGIICFGFLYVGECIKELKDASRI
jgi:hypothetical protein